MFCHRDYQLTTRLIGVVYALFINDHDRIRRDCLLKTLAQTTNLAYSLDGYMWAIGALAAEKLQIRWVMETHIIMIKPPLQIVDIGNGCEAPSANIYMPAKSELIAKFATMRLTGGFPWKRKQLLLRQNSSSCVMFLLVSWFCAIPGIHPKSPLIQESTIPPSTGTLVNTTFHIFGTEFCLPPENSKLRTSMNKRNPKHTTPH